MPENEEEEEVFRGLWNVYSTHTFGPVVRCPSHCGPTGGLASQSTSGPRQGRGVRVRIHFIMQCEQYSIASIELGLLLLLEYRRSMETALNTTCTARHLPQASQVIVRPPKHHLNNVHRHTRHSNHELAHCKMSFHHAKRRLLAVLGETRKIKGRAIVKPRHTITRSPFGWK